MEIPKLSEEQKQKCEGKISLQECEIILNNFRDNKSPGNDGTYSYRILQMLLGFS